MTMLHERNIYFHCDGEPFVHESLVFSPAEGFAVYDYLMRTMEYKGNKIDWLMYKSTYSAESTGKRPPETVLEAKRASMRWSEIKELIEESYRAKGIRDAGRSA